MNHWCPQVFLDFALGNLYVSSPFNSTSCVPTPHLHQSLGWDVEASGKVALAGMGASQAQSHPQSPLSIPPPALGGPWGQAGFVPLF